MCGLHFLVPCFEVKASICPTLSIYILIDGELVGIVSLWVLSNTRDSFFFQNKSYNWWNSWLWAVNRLVMKFIVKKVKRRKRRSMSWLGNQTRNQCLDSNGLFTFQNSEWKWAMKSSRGCGLSTVFYRIALNYCSLDVGIFPIH